MATFLRSVRKVVDTIGLGPYVVLVTVVPIGALIIGLLTMFDTKPGGALNVDSAASKAKLAGLMAFAVVGVVGGICLPYIETFYRQRGDDLRDVARGQYWVRWQLTPEAWRDFLAAEGVEAGKEYMIDIWVYAAIIVVFGGLAAAWGQWGMLLVVLATMLLLAGLRYWAVHNNRNWAGRRKPPEVFVARDFVVTNGKHTRFNVMDELGNGRQLAEAKLLTTQPPIIELTANQVRGRIVAAMAGAKSGVTGALTGAAFPNAGAGPPLIVRVPVPAGRTDEAKALIARFEHEVIAAAV